MAWKKVTERHERTAVAGIVRVTMEDAFGRREALTVTHNHPYLRAANDNGPGIYNRVRPHSALANSTPEAFRIATSALAATPGNGQRPPHRYRTSRPRAQDDPAG